MLWSAVEFCVCLLYAFEDKRSHGATTQLASHQELQGYVCILFVSIVWLHLFCSVMCVQWFASFVVMKLCWLYICLVCVCCPLQLNSYEAVRHEVVLGMGTEEHAVAAEVGTSNIQDVFLVREMVSSDEPQGIADLVNEDDRVLSWGVMGYDVVLLSEVPNQSPEDPLEDELEEDTGRSASALQRDELKQFHKTDNACFNGVEGHTCEESAVNEIGDVHSLNEPLGKVEQNMPDMVMQIVVRTEKVIGSEKRPYPTVQEDALSMSSSTSLQDPQEVIAEMRVN